MLTTDPGASGGRATSSRMISVVEEVEERRGGDEEVTAAMEAELSLHQAFNWADLSQARTVADVACRAVRPIRVDGRRRTL